MNKAVEAHLGPSMTALAIWPIQLSPAVIEVPLCWESGVGWWPGTTREKLGRLPACASVTNCSGSRMWLCWAYRHSAIDGQVAQMYPACPEVDPEVVHDTS